MKHVEQAPQAPIEFEDEVGRSGARVAGAALTAAGTALAGVGIVGMDKNEAKVDSDAFMSVPVGNRDNFITTADVPYIGCVALGVSLAAAGVYKLFARKKSNAAARPHSVSPDNLEHPYHKVHQSSE